MTGHHCHANDCPTPTNPKLLMCPKHWRLVPRPMQDRVWATFRARCSAPGADPGSWADYYEAAANAVEYVAQIEGKSIDNSYRRMVPMWRKLAAAKEAS
jgi:hypothetical protein